CSICLEEIRVEEWGVDVALIQDPKIIPSSLTYIIDYEITAVKFPKSIQPLIYSGIQNKARGIPFE
ncbi:1149_t:CDS:2, partial [Funneliformis mosseae]